MNHRILNLTQHSCTPEQSTSGVIDPTDEDKARIAQLLTFDQLPTQTDLRQRATQCAVLASGLVRKYGCDAVLIGGAPFFMSHLESALRSFRVRFCYAFSSRVAEEQMQPDGSVKKVNVFRHVGFIWEDE